MKLGHVKISKAKGVRTRELPIPGSRLRKRPSFYNFLQQLKKDYPRDTGIGGLIYDAKVDSEFPRTTRSRKQIREYLEDHDAERDCLNRFKEVWALYAKVGYARE